jgi:exodeoxyribonuclease V alpha subunit
MSQTELSAVVAEIHHRNPVTGWTITTACHGPANAEASAVGLDPDGRLGEGERYRFGGRWQDHPKYGRQFKWVTFVADAPDSRAGTVKYIARLCPGVGERTAAALWEAFGEATLATLMDDATAVEATGLLRPGVLAAAREKLAENAAMLRTNVELWGLLGGRGFPAAAIGAAVTRWGVRAAEVIRADPFALLEARLPGCGFARCDKLYCDLGGDPTGRRRLVFGLCHGLRGDRNGHTWFTEGEAAEALRQVTNEMRDAGEVAAVVEEGVAGGKLVRRRAVGTAGGEALVTLAEYDEDEGGLARSVRGLLGRRLGGVA